jgi:hypothetical protein
MTLREEIKKERKIRLGLMLFIENSHRLTGHREEASGEARMSSIRCLSYVQPKDKGFGSQCLSSAENPKLNGAVGRCERPHTAARQGVSGTRSAALTAGCLNDFSTPELQP